MSNKGIATLLAGMTMMNEIGGSSLTSRNHKQKKVKKISYKGLSAEEMGTSHKHKTRAERKRR